MNTIDNFDALRPIISFEFDMPVVYQIQIIQRRKENPDIKKNAKTLKHFFLYSDDDLDVLRPKIIKLCTDNRARAYLNVEAKSLRAVGHQMINIINHYLYLNQYEPLQNVFVKAYGQDEDDNDLKIKTFLSSIVSKRRWVLDADDYTRDQIEALKSLVQSQLSVQKASTEEPTIVRTPNGYHLISEGFNPQVLKGTVFESIEIKKHAPTILYAAW